MVQCEMKAKIDSKMQLKVLIKKDDLGSSGILGR